MSSSRSLRIGVLIRDRMVEERIVRDGAPITFGQSLRCTLSIPSDGVPREHVLFESHEGARRLRLAAGMTGRLGDGHGIASLEPMAVVAVAHGTRGKLVLGDVTILFQDIATPPVVPRPRLPASIRGTLSDRVDRRLAAIVGLSLAAHITIAAWAWSTDIELGVLGQPPIAEFRQDAIDVMLPDHADPITLPAPTAPTLPGTAQPVVPPHRIVPVRTPGAAAATDPQQLAQDASRMASILTGDDGRQGFGGMHQRQPGADLDHQIADARNRPITIGDGGHTSRSDDRARIGTDPNRTLGLDDPHLVASAPRHEEQPPRVLFLPGASDTKTTLTPAAVIEKIQSVYIAGLQRCYRLGLGEDATMSGKIAIAFTVESHGRATEPEASGLSPKVDSCIAGAMASWHFSPPRDVDGAPTDVSFKISLVLRPAS